MGALNVWADDVLLKMNEKTLVQLEKNAKILKALENEYKEERDKKIKINEELEADGFLTLEEKLNHLHNKLVDEQKALHERDLNEFDQVIKDQLAVDRSDVVGHTKEVTGVDALNNALNELVETES
jgi:Na+/phosphate symporter